MDNIINEHENSPLQSEDDILQCDRYGFRGGQQYTNPEEEDRVSHRGYTFTRVKMEENLRDRCRKGIPDSFRCEAWQRLCASPMVLVQRQRITCDETVETKTTTTGTSQSVDHSSKSKFPRHRFGTLSNRTNFKSLQMVITSQVFVLVKLKKTIDANFYFESCTALTVLVKDVIPDSHDSCRYPSALPLSLQNHESPNTQRISPWQRNTFNSESIRSISGTTHSSLHNLPSSALNNVNSSMFNQSALPNSGYSTIASVHGKSCSPESHIDTTDMIKSNHVTTTRNSGGYASLSTTSCTDSSSTNHFQNEIQIHEASSTDSCTSILISSSVGSSSSPILHRIARNIDVFSNQTSGDILTEYDNDDPRATLVPSIDLDPEKLYTNYCLQEGTSVNCDQIRRDIDRQFPFHELFSEKGGHGQESLYTLLKAYTIRHPEKGYCQGQAPLAAVLLMFMPEVDAFWTFNEICERYLESYYDDGLERVQIDGDVLYALLKSIHPPIYKFLRKYSVEPNLVVLEWFMCAYTRTLPWTAVLRIWDLFFCDGKIILFKVAIVLLNRLFGHPSHRKSCQGLDDILMRLREVSSVVGKLDNFIREVVRVPITTKELSQQIVRQSQKWAANHQKQS
ncbi:unnamed protein product [Schistosoma mattheei]|uniref:Rab-GAP TBC domain-containing protein n=1 Tax=Schistosoma mattheei TaxID=31246 RepID=A0AA85BXG2_9TREM|nr:unnamed protein product [Schistosoma mattheei]